MGPAQSIGPELCVRTQPRIAPRSRLLTQGSKSIEPLERKSVSIPVCARKMKLEWSKYSYGPMRRGVDAGTAGRHPIHAQD